MTEPKAWYRPPFGLDLVWSMLPLALVGIGFGVQPLKSWDYWWHIAFGRMIAATGEMPRHAHWLYTMAADAPAYVQPWISQLVLYEIHEAFGLHTVLLLRNALATLAFGALGLWAARRARSAPVGAILTLIVSSFGFLTIAARSHLLAWPLFLVILPIAYALRAGRLRAPWLVVFPVVTALWANLHGTFPVPPVVCIAFAAAEFVDARNGQKRSGPGFVAWGLTGVAALAATCANPRGWEVWGYLWMLSTNPELRNTVSEWWPALPWSPAYFGALFWVMLVFALARMWRMRAELDWADFFMVLWIAILTIPQSRFMLWFGLAYPIALAPYCRSFATAFASEDTPSTAAQAVHVVLAAGLVVVALAVQPWTDRNDIAAEVQAAPARTLPPEVGIAQADAPFEAVKLIRQRYPDRNPRLFHDHRYPGFLLWALDAKPFEQIVFVDNRVELPPDAIWRRFDAIGRAEKWREAFAEFSIEVVVTSYELQPELIAALKDDPGWECPWDDELWVLCWPRR